MSIADVFAEADDTLLQREANRIPIARVLIGKGELKGKEGIVRVLLAYYGAELLYSESIRHCLFSAFPQAALTRECQTLGVAPATTAYDTALRLASRPWNVRSGMVDSVNRLCRRYFGSPIAEEYEPRLSNQNALSIEAFYAESVPSLFDYQEQISSRLLSHLSTANDRVMVQMPTGSGKTRTATSALARFISEDDGARSGLVLWLAHAAELCDQAVESLRKSWTAVGHGELRLYKLWGNHTIRVDALETGVVVSSLQKLVSLKIKNSELYRAIAARCKAVIFDEAHKALARTYKDLLIKIAEQSPGCTIVGLSATPGRKTDYDQENAKLAAFFRGNILRPSFPGNKSPLAALREMGILAVMRRVVVTGSRRLLSKKEKEYLSDYLDFSSSFLEQVAHDEDRNGSIVDATVSCLTEGKRCLLFACSVAHAKDLSALLALRGYSAVAVSSQTPRHVRDGVVESFRRGEIGLIANYDVFSTGFDVPGIDAVIIARPTTSVVLYNQMIGRGLRGPAVGGKASCTLIDVVDNLVGFGEEEMIYGHFAAYWAAD